MPVDLPTEEVPYLDKVLHLCEYLGFAWILMQAVRATRQPEPEYRCWVWMYATSYGLLVEVLQMVVPWRGADWMDALMNALGAAGGAWVGDRLTLGVRPPQLAEPDSGPRPRDV